MGEIAFLCLGIATWAAAMLLPLPMALWFWNVAARRHASWAMHLLFAPSLIALEWFAVQLIFFAAHDDGGGPPGLGILLLLPCAMFLTALGSYYACLAYTLTASLWERLKAR